MVRVEHTLFFLRVCVRVCTVRMYVCMRALNVSSREVIDIGCGSVQVLAPERSSLAAALAALVVASLGNFSLPAFVSFIIDRSVQQLQQQQKQQQQQQQPRGDRRDSTLLQRLCGNMSDERLFAVCAGVFAASGIASFLRTYLLGAVTARTARRLRKEAFAAMLARDMEFFDTDEVRGGVFIHTSFLLRL